VALTDEEGFENSDWSVVDVAQPFKTQAPTPLEIPDDVEVSHAGVHTLTVSWIPVTGAAGYEIQWFSDSAYSTFIDMRAVDDTGYSCTLDELSSNTTYYIQVRALADADDIAKDNSNWVKLNGTTTVETPPTPSMRPEAPLGVSAATATSPTSLTVSWDAVAGATSYEIRYRLTTNASGKEIVASKWATQVWITQNMEIFSSSITLTGLNANAGYQFQVLAVNDLGKSDWSAVSETVRTKNVEISEENPDLTKVKFSAKPKAAGLSAVDHAVISWGVVEHAISYVITYTIPSGMKGVRGTTISKVLTGEELIAATSEDGKMILCTIDGLKSSASYKISIVANNASGTTTKAVSTTVKTTKVSAIKKVSVVNARTNTTISSITLKVTPGTGTLPSDFTVGGYIVQVFAPKPKSGEWLPVVTVAYNKNELEAGQAIEGLLASTKYTFVVMATNFSQADALMDDNAIKGGQKLSAAKIISASTARWGAVKLPDKSSTTTGISVKPLIPVADSWTKGGNVTHQEAYRQFAIYFWDAPNVREVFLGVAPVVHETVTFDTGFFCVDELKYVAANQKLTFIVKAVITKPGEGVKGKDDILNCSLGTRMVFKGSEVPQGA